MKNIRKNISSFLLLTVLCIACTLAMPVYAQAANKALKAPGAQFQDKTTRTAQRGLNFNTSWMFSTLIKDAARCNNYNSDIYYDLKYIDKRLENFNPDEEFEPIWIGFRKMGVDGTSFVLCKCNDSGCYGTLSQNYFALYSISIEPKEYGNFSVILSEYAV